MSKRSRKPSVKVMQNRTTMVSGGCVVYCLNVTSRIKNYAFQINRLLQTEVKRRKIQAKKEKNTKCMSLQRQMEASKQRQTRLQDTSAREAICSQLETLEKRAIHFITLLMFVLNFAF